MIKTQKFTGDEGKFRFTSDSHWGQTCEHWDNPLWRVRGYNSVQEHTDGLIAKWNEVCDDNTTVFHLGDFIFQDPGAKNFLAILSQLKFKELHCLFGNHRSGHKDLYDKTLQEQYPDLAATGKEVYPLITNAGYNTTRRLVFWSDYLEIQINKTLLVLSHYPILSHNGQSKGSISLSGHCHANMPLTNKNTGKGLRLDVGADSFPSPISLIEIKGLLKNRELNVLDHHT